MAANTGRTVSKYNKFQLEDSAGTLRDLGVSSIGGVGVVYDQVELTALQDVLHGFLIGHGTVALAIGGPFDTTVAQAASGTGVAPALSGSHVVLSAVNGLQVPLGFGIYFGMRQIWETGEPVFGLIGTAANGILVTDYQVQPEAGTYSAVLAMYPGSAIVAWGTAAIT